MIELETTLAERNSQITELTTLHAQLKDIKKWNVTELLAKVEEVCPGPKVRT